MPFTAFGSTSHDHRPRLSERLAERRRRAADRRQHDQVLADPRIAGEHQAASSHARAQGLPGCEFCG
jgi:hypothetical protein